MAGRPPKRGIDYAGWSVNIFDNDTKMDKLLDAQGWCGFGIYFYLCQRAYGGDGYFYKWCYDDCATTARKMGGGIGAGTVKETVDYCLQIGLFDKGLFDRWGVLTSRGIQKHYNVVIKSRDVKEVVAEYWLLRNEENCKGLIKLPINTDLSEGNTNFPAGNANYEECKANFKAQKERKVKKSKVKESKVKEKYFSNDETLDQAFVDYVEMRKQLKKPMTEKAIDLAIKKLNALSTPPLSDNMNNDMAIKILEQSVLNSWLGLFPLKEDKSGSQKGGGIDWSKV